MVDADQKQEPETKPCRVCGEDIKLAAQKCVHCDAWQNWRSGLPSIGATVLPLLVALISVSIAAIPIVSEALTPKDSIISSAFQASSQQYVSALISNAGGRPGTIRRALLIVPDPQNVGRWHYGLVVVTKDSSDAIMVAPGSSVLVQFRLDAGPLHEENNGIPLIEQKMRLVNLKTAREFGTRICELDYLGTDFDTKPFSSTQQMECGDLEIFILKHTTLVWTLN